MEGGPADTRGVGRPLVWVSASFAAGIVLADRLTIPPETVFIAALAGYVVWLLASALLGPSARRGQAGTAVMAPVSGALLPAALPLVIFTALGYLTAAVNPAQREAAAAASWDGRRVSLQATVTAPVQGLENRQRTILRITRLNGRAPPAAFSVMATLPPRPALRYGDVVDVQGVLALAPEGGNPGEGNLRAALQRQGISALLRASRGPLVVRRHNAGNRLVSWALGLRDHLVRPLLTLPEPYGGVLAGLLYGAQVGVGEEMTEIFRRAGLLHVLVVSGAQVGLLAASAIAVLARVRARPGLQLPLAGGVVLLFATMVGWGAAVGRAVIMALVGLGAVLLRRDTDAASTLGLAALIWLALYPASLFGLGFQLSFAATWGLLFLSPVLTPPWRLPWLAQLVGTSLGAQVAVLPLLAAVFQQISLAAFPANLFVLPIVAVLVPAGFVLSLAGLIAPGLGAFLAPAFLPPVWAMVALSRLFAAAPGAQVWLPPVAWWQVAAAYGFLGSLPRWRARGVRVSRVIFWALLAVALLAAGGPAVERLRGPALLVTVLDVGQGNAILVRGPTGRAMLVDGGGEIEIPGRGEEAHDGAGEPPPPAAARTARHNDVGAERVVPTLRRLGIHRIDVVLLSHAHEDHVGGLPAVLQNFSVGLVLDPGVPHASPSYTRFLDVVRGRRIPYLLARRGQRIDLGGGALGEVLWPPADDGGVPANVDPVNSRSVVVRVQLGSISVLLTGDIEKETEAVLLQRGWLLPTTALLISHHGSRTSTTPAFLEAVRPAVAFISVGRGNFFGHPHAQTLRTLQEHGVRIYRTDRDGAVMLRTDGQRVRIETMSGH